MALALLLFVFFMVIVLIALFVFPPTKWVQWFYNQPEGVASRTPAPSSKNERKPPQQDS